MATIKDVARLAGVSVSTISKYLNGGNVLEENAEAIRRAISELDYRVNPFARSLKTQRSRSIGILIPDLTAPFYGSFLSGLDKVLREHGYHSLVSCYSANHGTERDNLQFLISTGIDGLVYAPEDLTPDEFYELTSNCNIPVVQFDRMIQGVSSDTILVENAEANVRTLVFEKIEDKRVSVEVTVNHYYTKSTTFVLDGNVVDKDTGAVIDKSKTPVFYKGACVTPVYEPMFLQINKLKQKVDAGAKYIQTQGIFDLDSFKRFMEEVDKAGIKTHIMAGIIPLKAAGMAKFMNANVPGIDVPQSMIDRLAAAAAEGKEKGIKGLPAKVGMEMAAEMIAKIKDEKLCDGVHVMAIGAEKNVPKILDMAGLSI